VSQPPVHALLVVAPALVASAVALARRRGSAAATAAVAIVASAVAAAVVGGSPLSLDAVVPLVPLTGILAGEILATRHAPRASLVAAVPLFVAAGALAVAVSADWGEGHRAAADALAGRARPMWSGESDVASFVRTSGGRVLVDERVDAVAALLLGSSGLVVRFDGALAVPRTDLVLVRTPTGRGSAHRVAMAWPTLYGGGAPWATLAGSWPVSGEPAEYRLYAVLKEGSR
jgi:hypothetical protein